MKQIEITVRLNENMQSAIRKLEKQGFKKIRESEIDDIYMTSKLKELNNNLSIEIDGGVSDSNCQRIVEAGAEALVAGSYVFKGDMEANIVKMEKMCE